MYLQRVPAVLPAWLCLGMRVFACVQKEREIGGWRREIGVAGEVGGMRKRKDARGVEGCSGEKPIIVQITDWLWIFYQTSSAALSLCCFLSVPVVDLNSNSQEPY